MIKDVKFGKNVRFYPYINLYGCEIDDDSQIGPFVEIQKNVKIGKRCKISTHSFICEGVIIEDDVFIGHGVMFINDKYPKASINGKLTNETDWKVISTTIKQNTSIGSNSTILCGIVIGKNSIIGAGSVITKDIPDNVVAFGNPCKIRKKNDN